MVSGYLICMATASVAEFIMGTGGTASLDVLPDISQFMDNCACLQYLQQGQFPDVSYGDAYPGTGINIPDRGHGTGIFVSGTA